MCMECLIQWKYKYLFTLSMYGQAGVKNGMFMGPAKKLCPDLQTIPYDFDGYQEVSQILYDTVLR